HAKFPLAILTLKETGKFKPARALVPGLNERVDLAIRAALDPNPDSRPAPCREFFKLLTAARRLRGQPATPPEPLKPLTAPPATRRASIRFPLRIGGCGVIDPDIHGGESQETWPLVVRDVSAQGIGVLLARRFEPGAKLVIELMAEPGKSQQH